VSVEAARCWSRGAPARLSAPMIHADGNKAPCWITLTGTINHHGIPAEVATNG
jgi:hypothetical protein